MQKLASSATSENGKQHNDMIKCMNQRATDPCEEKSSDGKGSNQIVYVAHTAPGKLNFRKNRLPIILSA